jgi:prophage antirepressor-like protein
MKDDNSIIKFEFDGKPVPAFKMDGVWYWIAMMVGAAFGYARDGQNLVGTIKKKWIREFEEGVHYVILKGEKLRKFKKLFPLNVQQTFSRAPHLTLLTEEGIHLVSIKTGKEEGIRMRNWLSTVVFPQFVRDGMFDPNRQVVDGEIVGKLSAGESVALAKIEAGVEIERIRANIELQKIELEKQKEIRRQSEIDARKERNDRLQRSQDASQRRQDAKALLSWAKAMIANGEITNHQHNWYKAEAARIAFGGSIRKYKTDDPTDCIYSVTEFADMLEPKTTPKRVGMIRKKLNLTGDREGLCKQIVVSFKYSKGVGDGMLYSRNAFEMIKVEYERQEAERAAKENKQLSLDTIKN